MGGNILLLLLYTFMMRAEKILAFTLHRELIAAQHTTHNAKEVLNILTYPRQ
jgi:hypothetical protein